MKVKFSKIKQKFVLHEERQPVIPLPKGRNAGKIAHYCAFGQTRMGKDVIIEYLIENLHRLGYKIIDITNDDFIESAGFSIPCNIRPMLNYMKRIRIEGSDKTFWDYYKNFTGLKVEVYHPLIMKGIRSTLPPNFRLFTLPISFFTERTNIRILTDDNVSDGTVSKIVQFVEKLKKGKTFTNVLSVVVDSKDVKYSVEEYGAGNVRSKVFLYTDTSQSLDAILRPFRNMLKYGIFSSDNFTYEVDGKVFNPVLTDKKLKEIILDKKTITVFSTKWLGTKDERVKIAILNHILWRIKTVVSELYSRGKRVPTVILIREARKFFPNKDSREPYKKILADNAEDIGKGIAKAHCHLVLNTQEPNDLPDGLLSQIGVQFIFRINRKEHEIKEQFRGQFLLTNEHIKRIRTLENHRFYMSFSPEFIDYSEVDFSLIPDFLPNDVTHFINPLKGNKLLYKFTGHLSESQDDMNIFAYKYREDTWFKVRPHQEALASEWKDKSEREMKIAEKRYQISLKNAMAKKLGFTSIYAVKILYGLVKLMEENGRNPVTWTEIRNLTGVAKTTITDILNRFENEGIVERHVETKGDVILTDSGFDLYNENELEIKKLLDIS